MIWNQVELFNVSQIRQQEDGTLQFFRFPDTVLEQFKGNEISNTSGHTTTGCEIRFVGNAVDITLSADVGGVVEIFRGDHYSSLIILEAGVPKKVSLRANMGVDTYDMGGYQGTFSPKVWRLVFNNDFRGSIHSIDPIEPIRPPTPEELPSKTVLAYGSSITHSAVAVLYSNCYIATVGKLLGADMLCKGMGGSCLCEKEVADYIASEAWDAAILELGINMVRRYPVSEFEQRAEYLIRRALERGKPVTVISNFTSFFDLPNAEFGKQNEDYICCLENLCEKLKCENLYYIRGREIVTDLGMLSADLLHPTAYGHGKMGRRIAKKLRDEFGIL